MAINKNILVLECIAKKNEQNEGKIISEFINLNYNDKVIFKRITLKDDFFRILKKNRNRYIHISCHGEKDPDGDYFMQLAKGKIYPEEFSIKSGLKNRICFISACSLGKARFSNVFWEKASPNILIAPQRDIYFTDAATFWVLLYYNHFYLNRTLSSSYHFAIRQVKNTGAMQYYYTVGNGHL